MLWGFMLISQVVQIQYSGNVNVFCIRNLEFHHMYRASSTSEYVYIIVENEIYIVSTAFGNLSVTEFPCELPRAGDKEIYLLW